MLWYVKKGRHSSTRHPVPHAHSFHLHFSWDSIQFGRIRRIHVLESAWDSEEGVLKPEESAIVSRLGGIRYVGLTSTLSRTRRLIIRYSSPSFSASLAILDMGGRRSKFLAGGDLGFLDRADADTRLSFLFLGVVSFLEPSGHKKRTGQRSKTRSLKCNIIDIPVCTCLSIAHGSFLQQCARARHARQRIASASDRSSFPPADHDHMGPNLPRSALELLIFIRTDHPGIDLNHIQTPPPPTDSIPARTPPLSSPTGPSAIRSRPPPPPATNADSPSFQTPSLRPQHPWNGIHCCCCVQLYI